MQIEDVLTLLDELYTLPINGKYIRQYMSDLEKAQRDITAQRENVVKLLAHAQSSSSMRKLRTIIGQNESQLSKCSDAFETFRSQIKIIYS